MWFDKLTTTSLIVIKKILEHLGLWEESQPQTGTKEKK